MQCDGRAGRQLSTRMHSTAVSQMMVVTGSYTALRLYSLCHCFRGSVRSYFLLELYFLQSMYHMYRVEVPCENLWDPSGDCADCMVHGTGICGCPFLCSFLHIFYCLNRQLYNLNHFKSRFQDITQVTFFNLSRKKIKLDSFNKLVAKQRNKCTKI